MKSMKVFMLVLSMIMLLTANLNTVNAAAPDLDLPIQSALDKLNKTANSATKAKVDTYYKALIHYQELTKSADSKGTELHYKNEETLSLLQQKIKEVDAAIVANLEAELAKTKSRYQPLLNASTPLTTMLGSKVKLVTTAAQLARIDIQNKSNALKKAKETKASTIRKIRATLAEANPLKVQIKAAKSSISQQKTRLTAAGKSFNLAVKKGNIPSALDGLSLLSTSSRQISEQKQSITNIEQKISAVFARAKAQLPK